MFDFGKHIEVIIRSPSKITKNVNWKSGVHSILLKKMIKYDTSIQYNDQR